MVASKIKIPLKRLQGGRASSLTYTSAYLLNMTLKVSKINSRNDFLKKYLFFGTQVLNFLTYINVI